MRTKFTGAGTALVTPFKTSGEVDLDGMRRLVRRQIDAGIHFVSPCGTTAETPTLSEDERVAIVSLAANEVPSEMAQIVEAAERNDFVTARGMHHRLMPLMTMNFVEANPVPVKAAMAAMGLIAEAYRLPLVGPKPESKSRIHQVLK